MSNSGIIRYEYTRKPSKNLSQIMEIAKLEAIKSIMNQKHGAVIFKGQEILGRGYNYNFGQIIFHGKYSVHAEVDAILNAGKMKKDIKGSNILVIRISKNGMYMNSKPCKNCTNFILENGICNIYYST